MAISRESAHRIASSYLQAAGADPDGPWQIREVLSSDEVLREPLIYGLTVPLEECWIAYLDSPPIGIQSSRIVLVHKESGVILYSGSAGDEG